MCYATPKDYQPASVEVETFRTQCGTVLLSEGRGYWVWTAYNITAGVYRTGSSPTRAYAIADAGVALARAMASTPPNTGHISTWEMLDRPTLAQLDRLLGDLGSVR